jgi:hypothetical protein
MYLAFKYLCLNSTHKHVLFTLIPETEKQNFTPLQKKTRNYNSYACMLIFSQMIKHEKNINIK